MVVGLIIRAAMDDTTARDLVSLLTEALRAAADAELKLIAFERALTAHNPGLVQKWKAEIENLRKQAGNSNTAALNSLTARLTRP